MTTTVVGQYQYYWEVVLIRLSVLVLYPGENQPAEA